MEILKIKLLMKKLDYKKFPKNLDKHKLLIRLVTMLILKDWHY